MKLIFEAKEANYAYVTLLSTDNFLYGTLTLWQSLRDVKSKYPLAVIITEKITAKTKEELTKYDIKYYEFPNLEYPEETIKHMKDNLWPQQLVNTGSKLNIFRLVNYDKIVYLDSDMLVMKNIDWLFERPHGSAVMDLGPVYDKYSELLKFNLGRDYYFGFNSGLLVIEPSVAEYEKAIELLYTIRGYDQEIIRALWSDWTTNPEKQLPLSTSVMPVVINIYLFENIVNFSDISVLHFVSVKPFQKKDVDLDSAFGLCEKMYLETMYKALGKIEKNKNILFKVPKTGNSYPFFKKLVTTYIKSQFPRGASALDVGCGQGTYAHYLNKHLVIDGLDIYSPHDNEYTRALYNKVMIKDIRFFEYDYYDVVIIGDVLEHLSIEDAQKVIEYAKKHCGLLVVAIPYEMEQEGNENHAELHIQADLTDEIFLQRYPGLHLFCSNQWYAYYMWKKKD